MTQIEKLNSDHLEWARSKNMRTAQVQMEIALETAKSPLDPMALGLRYAEVEAIRREINDHVTQVRTQIAALLTPAQKTLLGGLEEARKLQPVIAEAECQNLLAPPPQRLAILAPAGTSYASMLIGVIGIYPPSTCNTFTFLPGGDGLNAGAVPALAPADRSTSGAR